MGLVEEHIQLTNRIVVGELSKVQVEQEINRIEKEYGESAFNSFKVKKKSAPWTKSDLDELEIQSASGACSKDFFLYMAEVSEFVYKKNKKRGILRIFENIIRFIAKNWLIIVSVVLCFVIAGWIISKFVG